MDILKEYAEEPPRTAKGQGKRQRVDQGDAPAASSGGVTIGYSETFAEEVQQAERKGGGVILTATGNPITSRRLLDLHGRELERLFPLTFVPRGTLPPQRDHLSLLKLSL